MNALHSFRRVASPLVLGVALIGVSAGVSRAGDPPSAKGTSGANTPGANAPSAAGAGAVPMKLPSVAIEQMKLPNGLDVILHEDKRTPIVTVNIWYHVGSKDEAPGKNGFAHLFEHVMFQGSKHVAEDTFFKYLEQAGGSGINGTTNLDRTNYFETVPSNRLELALWLESDRMGFLLDHADEATFKSQREVVKNERRQNYENAPYGLVYQHLYGTLYPVGHPYHLLTIGTPEDLDRASMDDVRAFFRTYYVPNNASLVIAGDFDRAAAKSLVEKYFAPIPRGKDVPKRVPPSPPQGPRTRLDLVAGVELGRVYTVWPSPASFAPGDAEHYVLAHVLASGKSSRLYKRLVYDMQIAQDVSCAQDSNQLAGNFEVTATAKADKSLDEIARVIDEEMSKVASQGVTDAEVARAIAEVESGFIFAMERGGSRANRLNEYNHYVGTPDYLEKDLAAYRAVKAAAVKEAAMKVVQSKARVRAFVKAQKGEPLAGRLVGTTPEGDAR
jgi:predicted Zn-dependent peptidase